MLMIYWYNLKIWKVKFSGRNSIHTLMSQRGLIFAARVLEMNLFRVIDCPCSNTIDVISLFEIWTWLLFYWFFPWLNKQLAGSYYSTRPSKQHLLLMFWCLDIFGEIIFFVEKKKNGEGREGKYLEKKNMLLAEGKKSREGKGGKY